jgi:hypothetical protein
MSDKKENTADKFEPVAGAAVPHDYRPPTHEETLGALPGVPKEVAEEYSKTGRTPKAYVNEVRKTEQAVRAAGLEANPGTAGQAQFPEDQEKAAKDQQRDAAKAQREQDQADAERARQTHGRK